MKTAIIVLQARKDSRRFPGKALEHLQGLPLLAHCIRRLKRVHSDLPVVVATSMLPQNDDIRRLAEYEGALCYRGSEDDVLDRLYRAACQFQASYIVRATGDNPLVDPEEAKRVFEEIMSGDLDYVCGFKEVDGLAPPVGAAVEAFGFESLEYAWLNGKEPGHREHVNEYYFDNHARFRTRYLPCLPYNHCPDLRLTVDTVDDLRFLERIGMELVTPLESCATKEIIECWRQKIQHTVDVSKDDIYKNRR